MGKLQLKILTPTGVTLDSEVSSFTVSTSEGQVTILPGHAAYLTSLSTGEAITRDANGPDFVSIAGGFMEVQGNQITVLADAAERDEEIDLERAESAMQRAQKRLETIDSDLDTRRAMFALSRARTRVKLARRKQRRPEQDQQYI